MATALTHLTRAMQHLSLLAAGATPGSDEQTLGLALLNGMLESYTAQAMLGYSTTIARTDDVVSVAVSGSTITTTENPGTKTTTLAKVAVSTYALISTNNTYPTGWDEAIQFNLALEIAGPFGVQKIPEIVVQRAAESKAAITPPVLGVQAA